MNQRRLRGTVVGLTGGSGSGKTALALRLRRLGASWYSVDAAAHALYRAGGAVSRAIVRAFGPAVLAGDGAISRAALREQAFSSRAALARLGRLVHPALGREAVRAVARMRRRNRVTVVEAGSLLFALGLDRCSDVIVVTRAPVAVRRRRLTAGRGWSPAGTARALAVLRATDRALARAVRARAVRGRVRIVETGRSPAALDLAARALMRELT